MNQNQKPPTPAPAGGNAAGSGGTPADMGETVIVHIHLVRNPKAAGKGWVYDLDADQFLRALNPVFSHGVLVEGDFELEEGKHYLVCSCESSHKHSRYSYELIKVENGEVVTIAEWGKRDANYNIPETLKEYWLEYRRLQRRGEEVGEGNIGFAGFLLKKLAPPEPTAVEPEEVEEVVETEEQAAPQFPPQAVELLKPQELEVELEQPTITAPPPTTAVVEKPELVKVYLLSMRLPSRYLVQSVEFENTSSGLREVRRWEGDALRVAARLETVRRTAYGLVSRAFAFVEELGVWVAVSEEAKEEAERVSKYVVAELERLGLLQHANRYCVRAVPVYLEPGDAEAVLEAAVKHLSEDVEELKRRIEEAQKAQNRKILQRLEKEKTCKEALLAAFKNYLSAILGGR